MYLLPSQKLKIYQWTTWQALVSRNYSVDYFSLSILYNWRSFINSLNVFNCHCSRYCNLYSSYIYQSIIFVRSWIFKESGHLPIKISPLVQTTMNRSFCFSHWLAYCSNLCSLLNIWLPVLTARHSKYGIMQKKKKVIVITMNLYWDFLSYHTSSYAFIGDYTGMVSNFRRYRLQ